MAAGPPKGEIMGMCAHCSTTGIVRIGVALIDGGEAVMSSCTRCEARTWNRNGVDVDVRDILPKLASIRRRRAA
jgi:excinuclease UvrABC ATPase subunit